MQKLYFNGNIITMQPNQKPAQAVLTQNNKIAAIGSYEQLFSLLQEDAQMINLHGNTMLPAFIDTHSHLMAVAANMLQISLLGTVNYNEIKQKILDFIHLNNIKPGQWIIANDYDHNELCEKTHPDNIFLDEICPQNPLVIKHISGHMGVFNSLALKKLSVKENTVSPKGGIIEKKNNKLTGYMQENAFLTYIRKVPLPNIEQMLDAFNKAQQLYASYGITTVQEGMLTTEMVPIYKALIEKKLLYLDVVGYSELQSQSKLFLEFNKHIKNYNSNFKLQGLKIFLDGSPQGCTAWMQTPYLNFENEYYGQQTMLDSEIYLAIMQASQLDVQILAHCNGDAAAQHFIDNISKVYETSKKIFDLRPVMIHAQLLQPQQLNMVKANNIIPSFFVAHVYYWGDVHIKNFGLQRAAQISPAASALRKGVIFTFHQDSPVIMPDMLKTVWCAVNRVTKNDVSLGEAEAISSFDALRAITANAAYQYFEENKKGTIEVGKNADFVILADNPLNCPKNKIKDIRVLQTIKDDKIIYCYKNL